MKIILLSSVTVLLFVFGSMTAVSFGQYGWGWGGGYHSSTVGEGYARGMGDVIRSTGQARLDSSQAAIYFSEARRNEINNRKLWTQTYFDIRRINREAREAERGPKRTTEDWIRFAQAGAPQRLSPSEIDAVNGKIYWPMLLRKDEFAKEREVIDKAFASRATYGTISYKEYEAVTQATESIQQQMKKEIRNVPSLDYTTAKRFLKDLNFESSKPAG